MADINTGKQLSAAGPLVQAKMVDRGDGTFAEKIQGPLNQDNITVTTLTAASANGTSTDQTNFEGRGLKLVIDVTAISGTSATLTVTIQGKDPVSGKYFNILVSAGLTATGTTVLTVYPGAAVSANVSANDILPKTWRVSYTITGTTPSVTATIGAVVII
jgi:hypothetical protein